MDEIAEIKEKIDIIDLVGSYVSLKKAGVNFKGLCPFHHEKSPSFMVNPERQSFKCFGCFPPGQLVKTPLGYHRIETLGDEHPVISGKGNYKPIIATHEHQYNGQLIEIITRKIRRPVRLTVDHKVLAIRPHAKLQPTYKYLAKRLRQYETYLNTDAPHYYRKVAKWLPIQELSAGELQLGDLLLYPINRHVTPVLEINPNDYVHKIGKRGKKVSNLKKMPLTNSLLELIGYWIAKGSNHRAYIGFSLGSHEAELAKDIQKITKELFALRAKIHYRHGQKLGIELTVCHSHLAQAFSNLCGQGTDNKHIPFILDELPTVQQRVLLEAIARGNGAKFIPPQSNKLHRSITTVSAVLTEQLIDILLRIGYYPSLRINKAYQSKRGIKHQENYTVLWSEEARARYNLTYRTLNGEKYWLLPIAEKRIETYKGPVYNLTIKDDHSYVVSHIAVANCGKGGDIFTFIQETESIGFGDALKMLADRAGVTLKPRQAPKPGEAPSEKTRYYRINALATQLFNKLLTEHAVGKEAREYLKKRGITEQTIAKWRIGYAPRQKVLTDWLIKRGFSPQEIQNAGKPDMFYDRIMFPILDIMGNAVGFTGRILHDGEPKYLNTPETAIFRKSRILFGLEKAKQAIKNAGAVIMTEGQMDVIAASQAGSLNVVATSGTALTQEQLRILTRYNVDIIFAFDADGAGVTATKRAIDLAIQDDLPVKIIPIPSPYKDIGDIVEQNPKAWLELVKKPIAAVEWHIENELAKYRTKGIERKLSVEEKKTVARELIPVLRRIPDAIEQAHYMQLLARRLEVKETTIQQAMQRGAQQSTATTPNQTVRANLTSEETLLGLLERSKEWQTQHAALYNQLKKWYAKPINDLIFALEEQYRGLSAAELRQELDLLVKRYRENQQEQRQSEFASRISQAEQDGDKALVKQLLAEFQQLLKEH